MVSLSVLVPVYNERHLVAASLRRLAELARDPRLSRLQVIVVDDCSADGTAAVLESFRAESSGRDGSAAPSGKIEWRFLRHERNSGKGKAIRTALALADCDVCVIHDADLEYHPSDISKMLAVFEEERADAVFGSRFAGSEVRRVLFFRHELGNRLLTFLTNVATDLNLTDMETCYKAVRTDLLKSIPLVSNDFRLEPELTIKLAKRGARLFEVPIRYSGRTYQEGKKIGWRDGAKALAAIGRFAASDDIYVSDAYGSETQARLWRAPRYSRCIADVIAPWCGRRILEIGAGVGQITAKLVPRERYVATDVNPLHVHSLRALETDRPYLTAARCDVNDRDTFPQTDGGFDTVVCLNVIGHAEDDLLAMRNIRSVLADQGRALVLVPHGPKLFGSLDRVLQHRRRYTEASLRQLAADSGFDVKAIVPFNRVGSAAWWLNGTLLQRRSFGVGQMTALNLLSPGLPALDSVVPLPPLSLIAALERTSAPQ